MPRLLALSKSDLVPAEEAAAAQRAWARRLGEAVPVLITSSATGEGLDALGGELVRRVVANMVHAMSGHDVVTRLEPGVTATVDRFAFDRILGNLLSNAAKFSSPGKPIEITVCDGPAPRW